MASSSAPDKPTVGILSIGDMGMGIAKLLLAHGYEVYTSSTGRSQHTKDRIATTKIHDLATEEELVAHSDIVLSIVPPRDALSTAKRIVDACRTPAASAMRRQMRPENAERMVFVEMNAISPKTLAKILGLIETTHTHSHSRLRSQSRSNSQSNSQSQSSDSGTSLVRRLTRTLSSAVKDRSQSQPDQGMPTPPSYISVTLLDAGIIGFPPSLRADDTWQQPSIPISGAIDQLPASLISVLNMSPLGDKLGAASTLKACFSAMNKAFTGLVAMSYTTAQTAGVLPQLRAELERFNPATLETAERSLVAMPPRAYRWVEEMRQIGETFAGTGGLGMAAKEALGGVAEMYKFIAEDTELGSERIGKRKRGLTGEDVAEAIREGIHKKKRGADSGKKEEEGEEKLELAWRGSWS